MGLVEEVQPKLVEQVAELVVEQVCQLRLEQLELVQEQPNAFS